MQGTIVKAISGFYYVRDDSKVYECKARGVFKNKNITPLVGDHVEFDGLVVTKVYPRKNSFERPPVANVETLVMVFAAADPNPSLDILDKFLVTAEAKNTEIIICINKCDLADTKVLKEIYDGIYPIFFISAKDNSGIDELKKALKGKQFALAGPSGVGKSTLTNLLLESEKSEVGEISQKSLRGKNTTRHTELFYSDDYKLFDTPGFTSFDVNLDDEKQLENYFPEFHEYLGSCRFDDCKHLEEPDCAVAKALKEGKISDSRYESYKNIYNFILEKKRY